MMDKKIISEMMKKEYTGESGAGMVTVNVNSKLIVTKVKIDPTVFAKTVPEMIDDLGFMEELFKAAVNQAIDRATEDLTRSYGIPL